MGGPVNDSEARADRQREVQRRAGLEGRGEWGAGSKKCKSAADSWARGAWQRERGQHQYDGQVEGRGGGEQSGASFYELHRCLTNVLDTWN